MSTLDEVRRINRGNQFTEGPPICHECPKCFFRALIEAITQQLGKVGMTVVTGDEQKCS